MLNTATISPGTGDILLTDVMCTGAEDTLMSCMKNEECKYVCLPAHTRCWCSLCRYSYDICFGPGTYLVILWLSHQGWESTLAGFYDHFDHGVKDIHDSDLPPPVYY